MENQRTCLIFIRLGVLQENMEVSYDNILFFYIKVVWNYSVKQ